MIVSIIHKLHVMYTNNSELCGQRGTPVFVVLAVDTRSADRCPVALDSPKVLMLQWKFMQLDTYAFYQYT